MFRNNFLTESNIINVNYFSKIESMLLRVKNIKLIAITDQLKSNKIVRAMR